MFYNKSEFNYEKSKITDKYDALLKIKEALLTKYPFLDLLVNDEDSYEKIKTDKKVYRWSDYNECYYEEYIANDYFDEWDSLETANWPRIFDY